MWIRVYYQNKILLFLSIIIAFIPNKYSFAVTPELDLMIIKGKKIEKRKIIDKNKEHKHLFIVLSYSNTYYKDYGSLLRINTYSEKWKPLNNADIFIEYQSSLNKHNEKKIYVGTTDNNGELVIRIRLNKLASKFLSGRLYGYAIKDGIIYSGEISIVINIRKEEERHRDELFINIVSDKREYYPGDKIKLSLHIIKKSFNPDKGVYEIFPLTNSNVKIRIDNISTIFCSNDYNQHILYEEDNKTDEYGYLYKEIDIPSFIEGGRYILKIEAEKYQESKIISIIPINPEYPEIKSIINEDIYYKDYQNKNLEYKFEIKNLNGEPVSGHIKYTISAEGLYYTRNFEHIYSGEMDIKDGLANIILPEVISKYLILPNMQIFKRVKVNLSFVDKNGTILNKEFKYFIYFRKYNFESDSTSVIFSVNENNKVISLDTTLMDYKREKACKVKLIMDCPILNIRMEEITDNEGFAHFQFSVPEKDFDKIKEIRKYEFINGRQCSLYPEDDPNSIKYIYIKYKPNNNEPITKKPIKQEEKDEFPIDNTYPQGFSFVEITNNLNDEEIIYVVISDECEPKSDKLNLNIFNENLELIKTENLKINKRKNKYYAKYSLNIDNHYYIMPFLLCKNRNNITGIIYDTIYPMYNRKNVEIITNDFPGELNKFFDIDLKFSIKNWANYNNQMKIILSILYDDHLGLEQHINDFIQQLNLVNEDPANANDLIEISNIDIEKSSNNFLAFNEKGDINLYGKISGDITLDPCGGACTSFNITPVKEREDITNIVIPDIPLDNYGNGSIKLNGNLKPGYYQLILYAISKNGEIGYKVIPLKIR